MLGYVSSERLTCLLLELADTSLFNAIATMKNELQENKQSIQDIVKYLIGIAIQIANGMVTSTFYYFKYKNNCVMQFICNILCISHVNMSSKSACLSKSLSYNNAIYSCFSLTNELFIAI